jgi:hypothetical protein
MTSPFVTWTDEPTAHANKRIEVTVRVNFIVPDEGGNLNDFRRRQLPKLVADTEAKWRGTFKCYDFVLTIVWQEAKSVADVPADTIDYVIKEDVGHGQTHSTGPDDEDKAVSEDPADAVTPLRGTDESPNFVSIDPNLFAHEIGHVIGLDDGYHTNPWWKFWGSDDHHALPGHPPDVMQSPMLPVLPSTIARVVHRHYGKSFDDAMKCPLGLRFGPSTFDLILASIDNISLDATTERYDAPSTDPALETQPATFTGTFRASGEYLTRFPGLPFSASGDLAVPVTFQLDLAHEPANLSIDLSFWQLSQTVQWDPVSGLPFAAAPLIIHADGSELDSSLLWPGPALQPEFYVPDSTGTS